MSDDRTKQRLRDYLEGHFPGHELRDDDQIFALGFVNSLFAMQLVLFVERDFDLKLSPNDLDFDNFASINAIAKLVGTKKMVPVGDRDA